MEDDPPEQNSEMEKVVSKDGTAIAFDRIGKGPTVILSLGALNTRTSGSKLAKLLSARFTVIGFDRRGRGSSTDKAPYTPKREVEDIAALIDLVGEPVFLYGHSSGGALALEASMALRKAIRKLAVYEVPYSLDRTARQTAETYLKTLKTLLAAGHSEDAVALFIKSVGVSDKQVQALKRMPMWKGLVKLAPTLAYDSAVLGKGHALPVKRLSSVTVPTLVMHGGAGAPSMRGVAREISETIPRAKLLTLARQTHGVSPKILAPVLGDFFR